MKFVFRLIVLLILWVSAVALVPRAMQALDNYNGQFEDDSTPTYCTVKT